MRKKIKRPVPADSWKSFSKYGGGWKADECPKADCDCYIVPKALWERAEKKRKAKPCQPPSA